MHENTIRAQGDAHLIGLDVAFMCMSSTKMATTCTVDECRSPLSTSTCLRPHTLHHPVYQAGHYRPSTVTPNLGGGREYATTSGGRSPDHVVGAGAGGFRYDRRLCADGARDGWGHGGRRRGRPVWGDPARRRRTPLHQPRDPRRATWIYPRREGRPRDVRVRRGGARFHGPTG